MSTTASPRHPAAELLARYRAIFAAAWAARHELAGPQRLADETAFLPARLSLQDTPVHPAPRRAAWAIVTAFVAALAWSIVGEVDIVAVAPGRIVVSDGTKLIQPLETSVVKAIHVKDGDRVQAGQLLIELDATGAIADRGTVAEQLRAAESEAARSQSLLQALRTGRTPALLPPSQAGEGWGKGVSALFTAEWQDVTARLAKLDAEHARRQAELTTAREVLAKLSETVPLSRQREADFRSLAEQGFVAGHAGQDRTRERIELERDLATQQARVAEAQAALAESVNGKAAYLAETRRALSDRLDQANVKRTQLRNEGAKSENRERLTRLTSPVAGTVQQLAVRTPGGVVTEAQALMVIVPHDAQITAEVVIENKDIGFVREGQQAQVKLDTFNFTKYGTVPAVVQRVSADAVVDEKTGAKFIAALAMQRGVIDVDERSVALAAGMNVTAEVATGRRRVIEYLLGALRHHQSTSLKER